MVVRASVARPAPVLRLRIRRAQGSLGPWPAAGTSWRPVGAKAPVARWAQVYRGRSAAPHSLWARFSNDRELVRIKLMLLAGLIVLTAMLEKAV